MSVTLEHPTTAHARLLIDLGPSDHMSVNLEHPTTAHARIFVDLEASDHMSVIWNKLPVRMREYL
jgi:hypothetical protein